MPSSVKTYRPVRQARHARVRAKISGTASRPRLSVFRSAVGMIAQLIDDAAGKTLAAVSTAEVKGQAGAGERKGKVAVAFLLGKLLAEKAAAKGIKSAVFDRGGYQYHGRVAALAEGSREGGLSF